MFRITLETDYALRMILLLSESGCKLDAKTISEKMNVPLRFALKILRNLSSAGLVQSVKGAGGGYFLTLEPSDISLKDVIEATEGNINVSRCLHKEAVCDRLTDKDKCPIHRNFDKINSIISAELDKIKFDSMI